MMGNGLLDKWRGLLQCVARRVVFLVPSHWLILCLVKVAHLVPSYFIRWFGLHYHGKVLTESQAKALAMCDKHIHTHNLPERVIPYPFARKFALYGPPDIAVVQCACRLSKSNRCHPTEVCLIFGELLIRGYEAHLGAKNVRRICTQEAVAIIESEHKKGHVHSAWFKDIMGDGFFALCNCCKCCCAGIESMACGGQTMASSGFVAQRTASENCILCGNSGHVIDRNKCLGCGACVSQCPTKCMKLARDKTKGDPLSF
ncbi:4Fe-4S ferredoxin [Pelomyxa schiedti]|nr:4Fe-4S ferredoxin [Pelomyxa schiedti]